MSWTYGDDSKNLASYINDNLTNTYTISEIELICKEAIARFRAGSAYTTAVSSLESSKTTLKGLTIADVTPDLT